MHPPTLTPNSWLTAISRRRFLAPRLILSLLALGALFYSSTAAGTPRPGSTPDSSRFDWYNLYPDLQDISAVSEDDAWAISTRGDLYHFAGGVWDFVETPQLDGLSPTDIEMVSATDGWIAAGYRAFQYDGTDWVDRSNGLHDPRFPGSGPTVAYIAPVGPDDVWGLSNGQFVHWDGVEWSYVSTGYSVTTISMPAPDDGWAAGGGCSKGGCYGSLYHYDGANWQLVANPAPNHAVLTGVWTSPNIPGHVWLSAGDFSHPGAIYHYDGSSWEAQSTPAGTIPTRIFMASPDEGWALTTAGTKILHWDGTSWTTEYTSNFSLRAISGAPGKAWAAGNGGTIVGRPLDDDWTHEYGSPTSNSLNAVSMLSADDAWAVGTGGATIHYDGNDWQLIPSGFSNSLSDVQMLAPDDVYAVGTNIIAHWDGSSWSSIILTSTYLYSVSMSAPGEGWAVGGIPGNQVISTWHCTGGQWSEVTTGFTGFLQDVAMDSPTHGWAVGYKYQSGNYGLLLEYVEDTWVDRSDTIPQQPDMFYTIALSPDGSEGWITGYAKRFLHLAEGVWSLDPYRPRTQCTDLKMLSEDDLWCTCRYLNYGYGRVVHRTGGEWAEQDFPFEASSISILPDAGGWAVGGSGSIARYNPSLPPPPPTSTGGPSPTPTTTSTNTAIAEATATATDTPPAEATATSTNTAAAEATSTPTSIPPTATPPPDSTPTACVMSFADVPPDGTFYPFVNCLACNGIISGYPCGGENEPCDQDNTPYFRPNNSVTRSQIAKIVSNAAGYDDNPPDPMFEDVPTSNTFFMWVQRLATHEVMGGYPCGGPDEPCGPDNLPYFRPYGDATRGQLAKIVSIAAGYDGTPTTQQFADVPPDHTFYKWVEFLASQGVMSGYPCGGPNEPCDDQDRPYFRPYNNVTRGQTSKIVAGAFFPTCQP